ncbi:hypothetical protein QBC43DRAFT_289204 [Cladorrhinum sp. PSN259]|nr:hypothetical protein QBC43DRAFT_289204 [Cladorrhinum sp. PSN259]
MATKVFGVVLAGEVARYINGQAFKLEEEEARITSLISDRLLSDGGKVIDREEYSALLLETTPTESLSSTDDSQVSGISKSLSRSQAFLKLEAFPDVDISVLNSAVWGTVLNLRPELDQATASRAAMKDLIIQNTIREIFNHCSLRTPAATGIYC